MSAVVLRHIILCSHVLNRHATRSFCTVPTIFLELWRLGEALEINGGPENKFHHQLANISNSLGGLPS